MNGTETVTVDFERYLHLVNIEKNFDLELKERAKELSDDKIERANSLYDKLKIEYRVISDEKYSLKNDIIQLKTQNLNQMFEIEYLKNELELSKNNNNWFSNLFKKSIK
jgi:hypothetical protein